MEFGVFVRGALVGEASTGREHASLQRDVALAEAAESSGFKYFWASEQHFLENWAMQSAPEVFLAFVAARTRRIHVGSAGIDATPAVNHPARVAERVAMLDHLSEGRFEFGVGPALSSTGYRGFGVPDGSRAEAMFEEGFREILRMWRSARYSHLGESFSMPERVLLPRLHSKPHPPLWRVCTNEVDCEAAGRSGVGVLWAAASDPSTLQVMVEVYREALASEERDDVGAFANESFACILPMACAEHAEAAYESAASFGSGAERALRARWLDEVDSPADLPEWPDVPEAWSADEVREAAAAGRMVAGDPEACAATVEAYEAAGVDQLIFELPEGGDVASIEVFGREVLGRFDDDPVHRTTRLRQQPTSTEDEADEAEEEGEALEAEAPEPTEATEASEDGGDEALEADDAEPDDADDDDEAEADDAADDDDDEDDDGVADDSESAAADGSEDSESVEEPDAPRA